MSGVPTIRRDPLTPAALKAVKKDVISNALDAAQCLELCDELSVLVRSDDLLVDLYDIYSIALTKLTKLKVSAPFDERFLTDLLAHLDDNNTNFKAPQNTALVNCLNKAILNLKWAPNKQETLVRWCSVVIDTFNNSRIMLSVSEICLKALSGASILAVYDQNPRFVRQLFANFRVRSLANASAKCLQVLYSGLLKGLDSAESWFDRWDALLFDALMDKTTCSNVQTYLVPAIIKLSPSTLKLFIDRHSSQFLEDDLTEVLIGLLIIGEQCSISFSSIVSFQFLSDLLSINNILIMCRCLELLVLSVKSKSLDPSILDAVKQCVVNFSADCCSVNHRNDFINALNAFIVKVKDCSYYTLKSKKPESSVPLREFLEWLVEFSAESLLPLSSYSQTVIGFSTINKLISLDLDHLHPVNDKDNLSVFPFAVAIFDTNFVTVLFNNLNSNYDDIRHQAFNTLLKCPDEVMIPLLETPDGFLSNELFKNSFDLCFSLKSRQSEGGAKFFQFFSKFHHKLGNTTRIIELFDFLLDVLKATDNTALTTTTIQLKQRIHGVLTCVHLMLSELPSTFFEDTGFWSSYFGDLVNINRSIWKRVEPVLTTLVDEEGDNDLIDDKIIANFSWKTIKESNILMSTLFKVNSDNNYNFLPASELLHYLDLVIEQLSTIKHRGTVSSIYPIFIAVVTICFRSDQTKDAPHAILQKNLDLIESMNQAISRRSGGLPNLLTGILTAEKSSLGTCSKSIDKTFVKLLDITKQELNPNYIHDLPQVNALNSIRNIFNDAYLVPDSAPYLVDALTICLDNFNSTNWSVKNCSLMLFSTLRNKLFSSSLKLSSSNFFRKYPNLKTKLLENLRNSHVEIVFSALEIVSKLNFINDEDDLDQFSSIIIELLDQKSWLIREMLARTLSEIILPARVDDTIKHLVNSIDGNSNKNHGIMLSILELLKVNQAEISQQVNDLICNLSAAYTSWSSLKVYVQILRLLPDVPKQVLTILGNILIEDLDISQDGLKRLAMTEVLSYLLESYYRSGDSENLEDLIELTFDLNFDFTNAVVDFLLAHDLPCRQLLAILRTTDDYTHLKVLDVLCKTPIEKFSEEDIEFLSRPAASEISSKSLELIAKHVAGSSSLQPYYIESILRYSQDEETEATRTSCLMAISSFIRASPSNESCLKSWLVLLRLLTDDSKDLRDLSGMELCKLLDLKHPVSVDDSLGRIRAHIKGNFTQELIEKVAVDLIPNYTPSIESKLNEYRKSQEQDSLFEVEIPNFFRKDVALIEFFYDLLDQLQPQNFDTLKKKCIFDCKLIIQFCESSGRDGVLGYSKNDMVYGAIAQGISELKSLRSHQTDEEVEKVARQLKSTLEVQDVQNALQKLQ